MCDTFLHPRPNFSTFLRSGANGTANEVAHDAKRFKVIISIILDLIILNSDLFD